MSADLDATIDQICQSTIAPAAAAVDQQGAFPEAAISALRAAGLLGLTAPTELGGRGQGLRQAAAVVERIARDCGSSAMVACMHYCGAAVILAQGSPEARAAVARGEHLSTLAFSEVGSRSHFWAAMGSATPVEGGLRLDGQKSWITSARGATAYVWSSRPLAAEGLSTLWLVPSSAAGLHIQAPFDGLGLRGNDSAPVTAEGVLLPETALLGRDGAGFDTMMGVVLPTFAVLNAACSIGLMEGAITRAAAHVGATRHQHLGSSLADLPTIRAYLARMKIRVDLSRALWLDTISALETGRPDAMLRVLEVKAAAGEGALEVSATAMRICGGAAYRKEVGVERIFRDAQAASIMAPTTDQLYDFIGKAVAGLPLF